MRKLVVVRVSYCLGCNVEVGGALRCSLSPCEIEVGTCSNVPDPVFDRFTVTMDAHSVSRRRAVRSYEDGGIEIFQFEDIVVCSLIFSGDACQNGGFRGVTGTLRGVGRCSDGERVNGLV